MYIRHLRVRNFMIHRDSALNLSPVTILVGPNGAGKSALFDALLNFSLVSRGNIAQAFGPWPYSFHALRHQASSPASRIGFEVELAASRSDGDSLRYLIEYGQVGQDPSYAIFRERLVKGTGEVIFDRDDIDSCGIPGVAGMITPDRSFFSAFRNARMHTPPAGADDLLLHCAKQVSRINKFRLNPAFMSRPSRLPDVSPEMSSGAIPRLGHHGEDLPSVLFYLSETGHPALEEIEAAVRDVIVGFERFEFNNVGHDGIGFSVRFGDSRGLVQAVHLSDGTLSLIGHIALVKTPGRPSVLCIEEPENGLTPRATASFYKSVHDLAFAEGDAASQVLMSSHSPFVICEAWNGEDREFIHQVAPSAGQAAIRPFSAAVAAAGIHLAKEGKTRKHLSLRNADNLMAGFWGDPPNS